MGPQNLLGAGRLLAIPLGRGQGQVRAQAGLRDVQALAVVPSLAGDAAHDAAVALLCRGRAAAEGARREPAQPRALLALRGAAPADIVAVRWHAKARMRLAADTASDVGSGPVHRVRYGGNLERENVGWWCFLSVEYGAQDGGTWRGAKRVVVIAVVTVWDLSTKGGGARGITDITREEGGQLVEHAQRAPTLLGGEARMYGHTAATTPKGAGRLTVCEAALNAIITVRVAAVRLLRQGRHAPTRAADGVANAGAVGGRHRHDGVQRAAEVLADAQGCEERRPGLPPHVLVEVEQVREAAHALTAVHRLEREQALGHGAVVAGRQEVEDVQQAEGGPDGREAAQRLHRVVAPRPVLLTIPALLQPLATQLADGVGQQHGEHEVHEQHRAPGCQVRHQRGDGLHIHLLRLALVAQDKVLQPVPNGLSLAPRRQPVQQKIEGEEELLLVLGADSLQRGHVEDLQETTAQDIHNLLLRRQSVQLKHAQHLIVGKLGECMRGGDNLLLLGDGVQDVLRFACISHPRHGSVRDYTRVQTTIKTQTLGILFPTVGEKRRKGERKRDTAICTSGHANCHDSIYSCDAYL
ncbi:peroxin-2 [Strigomonas culicis]|uniref:Peroxin-2 n=1 Tax=Strigomonas culicis TaxID=28005 RepID=S9WID9_9TRYP|nr:peroxin-2 [Strigomonas culicis]|eukprot:EPY35600.1 peroxin-2 [Strigomonas culicis]